MSEHSIRPPLLIVPQRRGPALPSPPGLFQRDDMQGGFWKKSEPLRLRSKHWLPPPRSPGGLVFKSHLPLYQKGNQNWDVSPNPGVMPEREQSGVYQNGDLRAAS